MSKEIEVVWYGGQRGSWCAAIVEFLTEGFVHRMDLRELKGDGAIVVVKADQVKDINVLARDLAALHWCLLIVTANEDGLLATSQFKEKTERTVVLSMRDSGMLQPNCFLWLQTPHRHQFARRFLPWGWTPGCATEVHAKKIWDWSFAGQITHTRRQQFKIMVRENPKVRDGLYSLVESDGFAKGVPQDMYYRLVAGAKVVPCPSGPVTVDSMRVCESLQLGAVPKLRRPQSLCGSPHTMADGGLTGRVQEL